MMNSDRGDQPKLTLLPFLISAMCRVLPDYPQINARFDDDAGIVLRSGAVHMGMATQTDNGLAVPVIRNAEAELEMQLRTTVTVHEVAEIDHHIGERGQLGCVPGEHVL